MRSTFAVGLAVILLVGGVCAGEMGEGPASDEQTPTASHFQFASPDSPTVNAKDREFGIRSYPIGQAGGSPLPGIIGGSAGIETGSDAINPLSSAVRRSWSPVSIRRTYPLQDRSVGRTVAPLTSPVAGSIPLAHLVYLGQDRVLYYKETGEYSIWVYDRTARGNTDPLKGPEVWGSWTTIGGDDRLIYLDNDRVLEWNWVTGDYRIWVYDRSVRGHADPFPGNPEVTGLWSSIHESDVSNEHDIDLQYWGGDRLVEYRDDHGDYRIWIYDRTVRGNSDPIPQCEVWGRWTSITDDGNHQLFYLDGHVVDLDQHGKYRVYWYERSVRGNADPLPGLTNWGTWSSIFSYKEVLNGYRENRLIYLGDNRVLVWENTGAYRIYVADWGRLNEQDPLPGGPEVWGEWKNIVTP